MNFIERSLKYKQVTLSVLLLFFVVGVYSLLTMSRREDPKITIRQALVVAYYPGASSTQVEEQLTSKIEEYLFRFDEVKRSATVASSQDGKVVINVELNDNVNNPDVFWSKLRQELMLAKQLDLPDGVFGPIVNSDFGDTEAMILGISGKGVPYDQLKQYTQQLEDQLRSIPSVSKVKRSGDLEEQILVSTNSAKMAQFGVTQQDIINVLRSQNDVYATGNLDVSSFTVPLYTKGYYQSQQELANQLVGASETGSLVHLKDIATLSRTYADPTERIRINDKNGLIISIQMLAGNNIVNFGEAVNGKIEQFKKTIPAHVQITTIADQPQVVDHNISHFIQEFMLAIIAVVVIILLMLPFRIALVAAMAIPMTVALTLALMNVFGIELHQVSLAALIVVLGLVVDDAIVVADNYVELLDKGLTRWEAAWKSASELVVPIFVATATIIFAFMPMVMLRGAVGEFIQALPITVTIALAASFIIAMVFTPLLCYAFITQGLHTAADTTKKRKRNVLDLMQSGYDTLLDWCTAHPKTTVLFSTIPVLFAVLLYRFGIRQQFFPYAERNQFVVELWMPTGTNFDATEKATLKLENLLKGDKRVVDYTSFVGTSAPRFYYNFSPEFPVSNYAQIVINTTSVETTDELAEELSHNVEAAVPDGSPHVRLMQQGESLKAPIEVLVWGENTAILKEIGQRVDSIITAQKGSTHIRHDFKEDYYGLDIRLKPEAPRLGFTTEAIAKSVYTGFSGAPVTTIREGKNAVKVILRLAEKDRQSVNDINKIYLTSPVTKASVPLAQVAELLPVWKTGRIMHRNGVKVLTVQSETTTELVPSQLLEKIQPAIANLDLPIGYSITYGGEEANQNETFGDMIVALGTSLLLIFFIILFQFRSLKEAAIIMLTIPLSLFGAMLGLYVTGNSFGFTAFVGLISLSGVVVRNAIILIDHVHELVNHHGMDLRTATIESGKRRLRPIFLTAMAAAIGVLPMIISGSPMWSPLASVIALGVVWSMVIALLTVPIFYLMWIVPTPQAVSTTNKIDASTMSQSLFNNKLNKLVAVALCLLACSNAQAQRADTLTLNKVVEATLQNNNLLRIRKLQVAEVDAKLKGAAIKKYPTAILNAAYQYNVNTGSLTIPAGALGVIPSNGSDLVLPAQNLAFPLLAHHTYNAGITVYQPITQLGKLKTGVELEKTERSLATLEQTKAELQLTNAVEQLYYGLLAVRKRKIEYQKNIDLATLKLYDVQSALLSGKTINANKAGLRADISDKEQELLKLKFQEEDQLADLKKLSGIPTDQFVLADENRVLVLAKPLADYQQDASVNNTDLQIAHVQRQKAELGIKAARQSDLPDIGITAGYSYQQGNAIYPAHNPFIGATFSWNIQDLFSNKQVLAQRVLVKQQADENAIYTKKQTVVAVENGYRKLRQAQELIAVAEKSVEYRRKEANVEYDRKAAGLNTPVKVLETEAALAKAEADLYEAKQSYKVALAGLNMLTKSNHFLTH